MKNIYLVCIMLLDFYSKIRIRLFLYNRGTGENVLGGNKMVAVMEDATNLVGVR